MLAKCWPNQTILFVVSKPQVTSDDVLDQSKGSAFHELHCQRVKYGRNGEKSLISLTDVIKTLIVKENLL